MTARNTLSETAARWFIRMRDAAPDAPERAEFEAWLMSSPAHRAEYASFVDTMDHLGPAGTLEAMAGAMEQTFQHRAKREKKMRALLTTAIAACVIGLTALLSAHQYREWRAQPVFQLASQNPVGKISTQTLDDGSRLTLSANSDIDITFYRHQRHVRLKRGEAIFEVVRDPDRPFVVEADNTKITVLGTRFAVNKLSRLVRVSVDHGRVQIESGTSSPLVITNGQVAEIGPQAAPRAVNRNAEDAFSFLQGKLVFAEADTHEIAETLSRYRAIPVDAQGNSPRNISAVINIRDAEQFLQGLPEIAPVALRQEGGKTLLIGRMR